MHGLLLEQLPQILHLTVPFAGLAFHRRVSLVKCKWNESRHVSESIQWNCVERTCPVRASRRSPDKHSITASAPKRSWISHWNVQTFLAKVNTSALSAKAHHTRPRHGGSACRCLCTVLASLAAAMTK